MDIRFTISGLHPGRRMRKGRFAEGFPEWEFGNEGEMCVLGAFRFAPR